MYAVNDYVVYRLFSVCRVQAIQTPDFESDKSKQYYRLSPVFNNGNETVVYVPVDSTDSLRPLFAKEEVNAALAALPQAKPTVCALKKPPQLTAYYQSILATCNLNKYLLLLKEVRVKEKANAKKLSEIDMRYRNKTEHLLSEELALILDGTPEQIKEKIDKLL